MFTSEHWGRLRATSAPDLRFSAGLIAAFATTLVLCARLVGVWTSDQNYRIQAVNSLGPETHAIIAGSSHVFTTLNPAFIGVSAMNLAAPVCSYVCAEGIVRGNLAKLPHVEALVLEYDAVPLFYDTLRSYQGDHRQLLELDPDISSMAISSWQKYELWRDQFLERSFMGPLFRSGKLAPAEALPRVRGDRRRDDSVVAPGYANGLEVMAPDQDGSARVARHVREAVGPSERPRNEAALRRSIELLSRLEHDYPGAFAHWDFGNLPWLSEADYRNGDHINDGASARVTAAFDQRLDAWLGETADDSAGPARERRASAGRR